MIKFFRHIRKSLIQENQIGKYFKYAVGEILLVMIGILLALQVNNWNENRKNTFAEQEFYQGIKNDLKQDKALIKILIEQINTKTDAFETLNTGKFYSLENLKYRDSLLSIYLFIGQRGFYPISGSFESALAGNQLNNFKQKDLIERIVKLYSSTYSRLVDNVEMFDERWNDLSKKYVRERRQKSFSISNEDEYTQILDDIYYHYVQLDWYGKLLEKSVEEIDKLLQKLDD